MAVYQFSALSDGQAISFNPTSDTLNFDQSTIAAADLRVVTEGSSIRINVVSGSSSGKDVVLLNTAQLQLATTNITFADGSRLLFGDSTAAQTADNNANSLTGTGGRDFLGGFGGADTLNGGAGNDVLDGGAAFDQLTGGAGNDTFLFSVAATGANADLVLDFATGVDKIALDSAIYSATGALGNFAAGDARFHAAFGATTGHDADDRVIYNTQNGTLWYDADGNGSGASQLIASLRAIPVLAATDIAVASSSALGGGSNAINGTSGNDTLTGTSGNDTINGIGGNDSLSGLGGDDVLNGGDGNDTLDGGEGNNTLNGGLGNDTYIGSGYFRGSDVADAGGVDTAVVTTGDFIELDPGIENLVIAANYVRGPFFDIPVMGNDLANVIRVETPADHDALLLISGGAGDDTVIGGADGEFFSYFGGGHDLIDGGGGYDRISGGNGNSVINFRTGQASEAGDPSYGTASFSNIEEASGGTGDDLMIAGDTGVVFLGWEGSDTLVGGAGNDLLLGTGIEWDHSTPNDGSDDLSGGAGNDTLNGGPGSDRLNGGLGNDWLTGDDGDGPEGNDTYVFDVAAGDANADNFAINTYGEADTIELHKSAMSDLGASGRLAAGDARFYSAAGATGGHDADDRVVYDTSTGKLYYDADGSGGLAAQLIGTNHGAEIEAGDIVVVGSGGGAGSVIDGTSGNDTLTGTDGNDTINGFGGNDDLRGLGGSDSLVGGDGNDILRAGIATPQPGFDTRLEGDGHSDTLDGGLGDDLYEVYEAGDIIVDAGGIDTVGATNTDWTLGSGLERLFVRVYGGEATGIGNELDNELNGNSMGVIGFGDGTLDLHGAGGNDTVRGGLGYNHLYGDEGDDTLVLGVDGSSMTGGSGADSFVIGMPTYGGEPRVTDFATGTDEIHLDADNMSALDRGGRFDANDARFYAAAGATGGHDGNDRVVFDTATGRLYYDADGDGAEAAQLIAVLQGGAALAATDIVIDNGSAAINGTSGNDSLAGGNGDDTIYGFAGNDTLSGGGGNDSLFGGDGSDSLMGGTGHDRLVGGAGVDTMNGGDGDDVYEVTAGDVISDTAGTDWVVSDTSWSLAPGVFENLILTGTTATSAQGNNLDNYIEGNEIGNSINGRAGNDFMVGWLGNDTFDMSTGGTASYGNDTIDGGFGTDTVDFGANAQSAVNVNLGLETMSGGGAAGAGSAVLLRVENVVGGGFNDSLTGDALANFLYGGAGNDTLAGGAGADRLQGAAGSDHFVFSHSGGPNADLVVDFASGADKLDFNNAFFSAIGADGGFTAGDARFWAAAGATTGHDANDRVVYNTTTGNLYYDADGSGSGAAQLVATIQGHPAVAATDIAVI